MSKKADDISQIDKYLNGKLDAEGMHQLERQAQNDPFLMDALEGYEKAGNSQQAQLDELTYRLQQRVGVKEKRIIPWGLIAIAASIVVAGTLGWLWQSGDHSPKTAPVAVLEKPAIKPKTATIENPSPEKRQEIAALKAAQGISISKKTTAVVQIPVIKKEKTTVPDELASAADGDTAVADTTPLNEMVVMNYTAQKKKDVVSSMAAAKANEQKKMQSNSSGQLLNSKVDGVNTSPNTNSSYSNSRIAQGSDAGSLLDKLASNNAIRGMVISKDDHQPIPGATVHVKGTKTGVVTDAAGKFTLPADSSKPSIEVAFIGYNTAVVSTNNKDSLKTIALAPNNNSLSEVVVSTPGTEKNDEISPVINAHPKNGWRSYRKYLQENGTSPDGVTGLVKLSFIVDTNGNIYRITVTKGPSEACDKKAIELVKNGPVWVGSNDGKAALVKIKVGFTR